MASKKVHRETFPDGFRWLNDAKGVNEPPAFSNLNAKLIEMSRRRIIPGLIKS